MVLLAQLVSCSRCHRFLNESEKDKQEEGTMEMARISTTTGCGKLCQSDECGKCSLDKACSEANVASTLNVASTMWPLWSRWLLLCM